MTKKHANLPITFAELGALLGTEQLMRNHLIVHEVTDGTGYYAPVPHGDAHMFNMDVTCKVSGCASVGCIGGTMAQIMGLNQNAADTYVRIGRSPALYQLFFPPDNYDFKKITIKMALSAIKQFRETGGKVNWNKVPSIKKALAT